MKASSLVLVLMSALLFFSSGVVFAAPGEFLIVSSFKDNDLLSVKMGGNFKGYADCVGENISPKVSWANVPLGTKSFVLSIVDPEANNGLGVDHLFAYGIPQGVNGFASGELSKSADNFFMSKNVFGEKYYIGPCPPAGVPHHYIFTLIATDLDPKIFHDGMAKTEVLKLVEGHTKAGAVLIGRFKKP